MKTTLSEIIKIWWNKKLTGIKNRLEKTPEKKKNVAINKAIRIVILSILIFGTIQLLIVILFKGVYLYSGTLIFWGIISLFIGLNLVNLQLFTGQLSLNPFTKKVKEHLAGLSWKWFWCKLQKPLVDLRATIIITSGGILLMDWEEFMKKEVYKKIAPRIYETADSILYGSWATAIRCAPGYIETFLLQTPQVGALMTMSEIDLTISDYLAKKGTEDVLSKKKEVSDELQVIFGGDNNNVSSSHEEDYGLIVSNTKLFDLNYGERSQIAAEKLFEVKKWNQSLLALKDSITDEKSRIEAVNIATGMVKKSITENIETKVVKVDGLENMLKNAGDNLISYFTAKSLKS